MIAFIQAIHGPIIEKLAKAKADSDVKGGVEASTPAASGPAPAGQTVPSATANTSGPASPVSYPGNAVTAPPPNLGGQPPNPMTAAGATSRPNPMTAASAAPARPGEPASLQPPASSTPPSGQNLSQGQAFSAAATVFGAESAGWSSTPQPAAAAASPSFGSFNPNNTRAPLPPGVPASAGFPSGSMPPPPGASAFAGGALPQDYMQRRRSSTTLTSFNRTRAFEEANARAPYLETGGTGTKQFNVRDFLDALPSDKFRLEQLNRDSMIVSYSHSYVERAWAHRHDSFHTAPNFAAPAANVIIKNDPRKGFTAAIHNASAGISPESIKLLFECGCCAAAADPSLNPLTPNKADPGQLLIGLDTMEKFNNTIETGKPKISIVLSPNQIHSLEKQAREDEAAGQYATSRARIVLSMYERLKPQDPEPSRRDSSDYSPV